MISRLLFFCIVLFSIDQDYVAFFRLGSLFTSFVLFSVFFFCKSSRLGKVGGGGRVNFFPLDMISC